MTEDRQAPCPACGAPQTLEPICPDCAIIDPRADERPERLHATFVWRRRGGDLELLRGNEAAIVFTRGRIDQLVGRSASELYADDPDIAEALQHAARSREVVVQRRRYRLRSLDEERDVEIAYRPGCRDLILVTVLEVSRTA